MIEGHVCHQQVACKEEEESIHGPSTFVHSRHVFMTNHVHLLATPGTDHAVSAWMQFLGRHDVRYVNDQ